MSALRQFRCTPLSAWLLVKDCDANRARAKEAKGTDAIALKACVGCDGVLARHTRGDEPEPRSVAPIEVLVTDPDAKHERPGYRRMVVSRDPKVRSKAIELMERERSEREASQRVKAAVVVQSRKPTGVRSGRPGRPRATECGRGHDLTSPENVYQRPDSRQRQCAICKRMGRAEIAQEEKVRICKNERCRLPDRKFERHVRGPVPDYCSKSCADDAAYDRKKAAGVQARPVQPRELLGSDALPPGMAPVDALPGMPPSRVAWEQPFLEPMKARANQLFTLSAPNGMRNTPKDLVSAANKRRRSEGFEFYSREGRIYGCFKGAA